MVHIQNFGYKQKKYLNFVSTQKKTKKVNSIDQFITNFAEHEDIYPKYIWYTSTCSRQKKYLNLV